MAFVMKHETWNADMTSDILDVNWNFSEQLGGFQVVNQLILI